MVQNIQFASEVRKLYHFIEGGDNKPNNHKKYVYTDGTNESENKVVKLIKDKRLHQVYKIYQKISKRGVDDDNYMILELRIYPLFVIKYIKFDNSC